MSSISSRSSRSNTSTGSRVSTQSNKIKAIEDLQKAYARRNFLKSVLNEEDDLQDTLKMKYTNPYTSNAARRLINSSFDSYRSQSKSIQDEITKLQLNFNPSTGRFGRVTNTKRVPVSQYSNYPYLTENEIKSVQSMASKQIGVINPNFGNHIYNTSEKKLKNSTINGIDQFLGFPQSHSNSSSVSSISSGSSYGGKGKKRTTKSKKRVTKK